MRMRELQPSNHVEDASGGLDAAAILALWERGERAEAIERASLLAAWGSAEGEGSGPMSLRARSEQIVRLRRATFGDRLDAVAECPNCTAEAEFSLSCAAIEREVATSQARLEWAHGPFKARLRELTVADLRRIATELRSQPDRAGDERLAIDALLGASISRLERDGVATTLDELPDTARAGLVACVDAAHDAADLRVELRCPGCDATRTVRLDLGEYVWAEVAAAAERLLGEIHLLARSYGWTEREIMTLASVRRAAYVSRCSGARA